jgi:hypothetical protein
MEVPIGGAPFCSSISFSFLFSGLFLEFFSSIPAPLFFVYLSRGAGKAKKRAPRGAPRETHFEPETKEEQKSSRQGTETRQKGRYEVLF